MREGIKGAGGYHRGVMVELVNVVGSGSLDVELDLRAVFEEMDVPFAEYRSEGIYFRLEEDGPLIVLSKFGKYLVTGAKSMEQVESVRKQVLSHLHDLGVISSPDDTGFSIQNCVGVSDLDQDIELNALTVGLGLEYTEYEPEQFPGIVYRPPNYGCVFLIFSTGRVVITGADDKETVEDAFADLQDNVNNQFN